MRPHFARPLLTAAACSLALVTPGVGCGAHASSAEEPVERPAAFRPAAAVAPHAGATTAGARDGSGTRPATADGGFDVRSMAPYFGDGAAAKGLEAFRTGSYDEARRHLETAAKKGTGASDVRLRFLLAMSRVRSGAHAEAAADFEALVKEYPLLADYHHYYAALARANTLEASAAVAHASAVPEGSVLRADAMLVAAEARMMAGETTAAETAFTTYLKTHPDGPRTYDAAWSLARLRKELGSVEGARRAWRWLLVHDPMSSRAGEAEEEMKKSGGLPAFTPDELIIIGGHFHDAQQHDRAIETLDRARKAIAARPDAAPRDLACTGHYKLARSYDRRKKRATAATEMAAYVKGCAGHASFESGLYHAARLSLVSGRARAAMGFAERLQTEFPDSSLADDAMLFIAQAHRALGDEKRYRELVMEMAGRYPDGDMAEQALWNLAWSEYLAGRRDEAERFLDHAIETIAHVETYYGAGRALYWKGRLRELAKDRTAANATYERCVAEYPFTYYATLSYARLADAGAVGESIGPLLRAPEMDAPGGAGDDWAFPSLDITKESAFQRGVELLRLGLADEARKELATLPMADDDAGRWLVAVLYDNVQAWRLSHNIPRRRIVGWSRNAPVGAWRKHWLVAFPDAFATDIESGARDGKVPPALLVALIREESAFDPAIESWANAIGLTQLLLSTAKGVARGMPRFKTTTITIDLLRNPAVNVPIGATFLGGLLKRWKRPLLAIGGYNAGGGAVKRWVDERGHLPLDEYVERIPYDQTRHYTKRVMASYATYAWLYGGETVRFDLSPAK